MHLIWLNTTLKRHWVLQVWRSKFAKGIVVGNCSWIVYLDSFLAEFVLPFLCDAPQKLKKDVGFLCGETALIRSLNDMVMMPQDVLVYL